MTKRLGFVMMVLAIVFALTGRAGAAGLESSEGYAAVLSGSVGLYSDIGCTKEVLAAPGSSAVAPGKTYYIKERSSGKVFSGSSCYIYANAVYNTLFGDVPYHGYSDTWQQSACVASAKKSVSYADFAAWGVQPGALLRTTGNSDGTYNGDKGHSVILLSYDRDAVRYLEGNGDGRGLIRTVERSWDELNAVLFRGRGYRLAFIVSPADGLARHDFAGYFRVKTAYPTFSDVSDGAWYYESVKTACELGLMDGQGGRKFAPAGYVTNAEAAVLAARLLSYYWDDRWDFSLKSGDRWYDPYDRYLERWGIAPPSGASWEMITRGDFAQLIYKAAPKRELTAVQSAAFPDVSRADACYGAVTALANAGILRGAGGLFNPEKPVTRAEAAAMLVRLADRSARTGK